MNLKFLALLLVVVFLAKSEALSDKQNSEIVKKLLKNYDTGVRPKGLQQNNDEGMNGPVTITTNILFRTISRIDEQNGEFATQITLRQQWVDKRLAYGENRQLVGNLPDYVTMAQGEGQPKIWMPDTFFLNEKEAHTHNIATPNALVRIFKDGGVLYSIRLSMVFSCPMNFHRYPLDVQQCGLEIGSYAHPTKDIDITFTLITPLQCIALIESVQSGQASEPPRLADCVINALVRVRDDLLSPKDTCKRIPMWNLLLPTVIHRMLHYALSSIVHYFVRRIVRRHLQSKSPPDNSVVQRSMFDDFYPELFASFSSHLAADAILFPLELVLHRLYVQGTRAIIDNLDSGTEVIPVSLRYTGVFNCFATVVANEGALSLYKGFGGLCLQYCCHFMLLRVVRAGFDAWQESLYRIRPAGLAPNQHSANDLNRQLTPPNGIQRSPYASPPNY